MSTKARLKRIIEWVHFSLKDPIKINDHFQETKTKQNKNRVKKKKKTGMHVEVGRDEKDIRIILEVSLLYNISY